ncbi:MAG: DUF1611 domain-containing protein, partial [bacterium]|nr:DUF1611 domain-containing protein [bacterium]
QTTFAKTSHGLVRGPSRYPILGIVDASCAGRDAGEVLDGRHRNIPIFDSLGAMLEEAGQLPDYAIVGVATPGGVLPPDLRASLVEAAEAGISLINGLHSPLADHPDLVRITQQRGRRIIDFRKPRPIAELRFWSGESLQIETPRIPVLGTDCAVGKRTTCNFVQQGCRERGIRAEIIYTGQTGWLQGFRHGFFLDATPNDFVCGELEKAILDCQRDTDPELMIIEGQGSLRNPSGPCGSELILGAAAKGVILQHAPGRELFIDMEELGCRVPPIGDEIRLIELLGAEVWALCLSEEALSPQEAEDARARLAEELRIPVLLPLRDGPEELTNVVCERLGER